MLSLGLPKRKVAPSGLMTTELRSIDAISETRNRDVKASKVTRFAARDLIGRYSFSPASLKNSKTTSGSQVELYFGLGGLRL